MKTRNLKTKTLSILLAIVMLLGMLPVSVFAAESVTVTGETDITMQRGVTFFGSGINGGYYVVTPPDGVTFTNIEWSVSGDLPAGITLGVNRAGGDGSARAYIGGTPTAMTNGAVSVTINAEATDGTNTYTGSLAVSITVEDSPAYMLLDELIQGTVCEVPMATANTAEAVAAWVQNTWLPSLDGYSDLVAQIGNGYSITVEDASTPDEGIGGFTAAVAGTEADPNGTDGSLFVRFRLDENYNYLDNSKECIIKATEYIEHKHEWGEWKSNGDGTHTHTCTVDPTHTETADCAVYTYASVDEQNHNILCECMDVLGTEAHTMSDWVRDGEGDRRECTKHCDYYEEREHTHDWSDYTANGNGMHIRKCTAKGCTSQQTSTCGGRATCHELAFCPDCKTTYGEYDQKNHSGGTEVRNAKKATETENGYTGDTYCLGCETLLNEGSIIYATGSGDDDDNTHTHNYSYYNYDGTNHWKMCHCGQGQAGSVKPHSLVTTGVSTGHLDECTVCNYNSAIEDHVYTDDSDAFCNECGYMRHVHEYYTAATCTSPAMCRCRETTGDKDPTNHTGGTEIRDAKEATETEKGYTGDTYCRGCGAKLASGKYTEILGFVDVKYDDDVVVKEVTFQPIAGVTLPDDAEVIVGDHTATIEPVAAIVGSDDEIEYITVPDSDIYVSEPPVVLNGVTYNVHEIIMINGEEFLVVDTDSRWLTVMRLSDSVEFRFDGENLKNSEQLGAKAEKRENQKLNINGVTYDVVAVRDGFSSLDISILYYKGKPAGEYRSETGIAAFKAGFDPATLKAQRDDIYLGRVTADKTTIADLTSGKTYNAYVVGANDIHLEGAENVGGIVTQTFEISAEFVGNENVKFVAVHDTNPYAEALAEALAKQVENFTMEGAQEYLDIKALYDEWEATNGRGTQFGEISLFEDGKTLIATYEVDSFSPFIVYAFVEADEPEIKTLSATVVDDATEQPANLTWLWITIAVVIVVGGGFAVYWFIIRKRRTANR